jgi:hypothetical protein
MLLNIYRFYTAMPLRSWGVYGLAMRFQERGTFSTKSTKCSFAAHGAVGEFSVSGKQENKDVRQ